MQEAAGKRGNCNALLCSSKEWTSFSSRFTHQHVLAVEVFATPFVLATAAAATIVVAHHIDYSCFA